MLFQLGDYQFVTFHRLETPAAPPEIVQEETLPIDRPGVDGTGIVRLGNRGQPFLMRSGVDVLNKASADLLQTRYARMIAMQRYDLTWADTNYNSVHNCQYVVLNVKVMAIKKVSVSSGGLLGGGAAFWVEALWTLVPVPAT